MWGLSPSDNDSQIDAYKVDHGITNPCAGTDGGGPEAIDLIIEGQQFLGYPTYCIVCPDKSLYFDVCYPPSGTCFDPFIEDCSPATSLNNLSSTDIFNVYPNPTSGSFNLTLNYNGFVSVNITNMLGTSINRFDLIVQNNISKAINLEGMPNGIYFVTVRAGNDLIVKKLKLQQ